MELQMAKVPLLFHVMPLLLCLLGAYRKYLLSCPLEFHPHPHPRVLGGSVLHRPTHVTCSGSEILTTLAWVLGVGEGLGYQQQKLPLWFSFQNCLRTKIRKR